MVAAVFGRAVPLSAQAVCGTPGKDGPGGTLGGIVNTYYPGAANAAAGASSITLGTATGAAATITPGDLLLVIQMQDATIDFSNTSNYGAGTGTGSGATSYGNTGRYEYVTATNTVGAGGGSLTLRGTGAGNGLINAYTNANATASSGQRRFQVIRVPQYSSATLGSTLTAAYWNGATGGILAIDVAGQLTLGGTVSVDGRGFRGGAGLGFGGGSGGANTDFRSLSTNPFHAPKGEGVAGTPRWVLNPATNTNTDLGVEGYPSGDFGQGAPGNAGGGGNDGNPTSNDQNSGGGGGSNGGAGGQGGFTWSSGLDRGGRGGQAFGLFGVGRVILGGGGGSGTRNNSSAPLNAGGAGGGIVLIRAGTVTGSGTITANGLAGQVPLNDGGGGGGAGGSVVVLAASGGLGSLSVQARGGDGGNAWPTQAGAGNAHGPGGGGGGGVVVTSTALAPSVTAGVHGITTTGNLQYGSTDGAVGQSTTAAITASPGTSAGAACVPNLTVTKTTTTALINNTATGTTATYRIVVANAAGRDTARTVSLLDTLPTGFTYASNVAPTFTGGASRPTTSNPAVGDLIPQWAAFSIPGGGSVTLTFVANVASSVPNGVYNNPARALYLDPTRTTPTGTTSVAYDTTAAGENVTVRGPDLTVTKTHAGSFTVGTNGSYSIVVRNSGNRPTAGTITVVDTLPTGLGFVSAAGGATWSCSAVGQIVTCTRTTALNAATNAAAITLTVSVAAAAAPSVTNRVWVSGGNEPAGNAGNNSASDPTTVNTLSADVATTKTGPATVNAGVNAVYTIGIRNNGPNAATGIVVTDTLPTGATFISATGSGTLTGNVVTWPAIATLANGATTSFTVTVRYAEGGTYTDIAASTATTTDPTPGNNNGSAAAARVATVVTPLANLTVTKTGPGTGAAGADITYTVGVSNGGPSTASNVVVTDTLPTGATFVSATGSGTLSGNVVTWPTIATLINGGSASFQITLRFAAGGSYTNIAAATSATTDPNLPNRATATTVIGAAADVVTTKTGPATATTGSNVTYTVTATNNGPNAAVNVVITDTLPVGAAFVSATGGGTATGSVVTWPAIASLANGGNTSFTVTVSYAAIGAYTDIAASTATTADPTPANNNGSAPGARVTTTVSAAPADVAITKSGPATVTAGANAVYTMSIVNNGPGTATGIVVTDTLPAGATFVSATGGGTASGNVVTWPAIASLANAATASFTITVSYADGGTYTDVAAGTATTPDPTPGNNNGAAPAARVATTVTPSANLTVTKTGPAAGSVNTNIAYTVAVSNAGPSAAVNVVVTDTLPAGATFVSASGGGVLSGNVVTWPTIASLASGGSASFTITLSYAAGGGYTNVAAAASPTGDPALPNRATATTTIGLVADVVTTKSGPATAIPGADVTYTITATNNGPNAAASVVVTDTLPAGATFVSATGSGSLSGTVVTWPTIASLASGVNQSFTVTVSYAVAGSYLNLAASTSTTADPTPGNNNGSAPSARVTTAVAATADLSIANTGPATANAGENVSYTLTATNNGPSTATNVVVTDTLPAGATFVSATGGGTLSGNVVTWPATASLSNGGTVSFTLVLSYPTAGNYTNVAAVTSATSDPNLTNNRAPATTAVGTSADVVTTKSGPTTVAAGVNAAYTITATNNGPSASANVVVTDTLPAGATFVSATGGGTASGSVVTWPAIASLANGANQSFTVTVTYAAAGTYTNIAASTSATPDPTPANNNGSAGGARVATTVSAAADLSISNVGPATANAGENVSYTITATNNGPSDASNVVVTDTLPAGATFVSATGGGTISGNVVTWPATATLANGGSVSYTLVLSYPAPGTFANAAAVTTTTADPNLSNNRAPATTVVGTAADVVTTKSGPATVSAGTNATYTINTVNNGPSSAANVVVTDTLPAGATFVGATGGGTLSGSVVTWPAVTLASAANQSVTVTVSYAAGGTYTNIVASTSTTPDPTPANNNGSAGAARVATTVAAAADLSVTNVGPATANAGENVSYTITASNSGPSTATNVVVTDTLPAGATFVSASGGGTLSGNVVTWPATASLANGGSVVYTLVLTYPATGSYTNTAAVTSATADPNLANNKAPAATVVSASADVVTTKTGPATATAGQNISYTITATNNGPSTAGDVVVTDTLPTGLTFVSATGGGTLSGNVVTWPTIATLTSGGSQSFTLVVQAADGGSYTNIVASTSSTPDPAPGNNNGSAPAARVTTAVGGVADVVTTKTGPATATAGQDITYTISTANNGPSVATSVAVTDTLPAGVTFVSASNGGTEAGGVVTWPTVASLAASGNQVYTVVVRASAGGSYLNIVASTSATPDPTPANNNGSDPAARVTTTVAAAADVATTKTGPATANAGQDISYTITTTNNGPSPAVSVVVTDTLPAGVTFVSASNGGTLSGNVVTWPTIASLAASGNQSYTLVVRATEGGSYTNIVASTSATADPTPGNNNGSAPASRVTTAVTSVADVVTTQTGPATGTAGVNFSYSITVTNNGPSAASNVAVTDSLPLGLVFVSASGGGTASGGVVTFPTIASIPSGGSVTFTVTVVSPTTGSFTSIVAGSAATGDPVASNNNGSAPAARVTTVIGAVADVVTTKSGPATANAGQDISFTITTINNGPSSAASVVVTDTLPAGLTFVSASNGGTLSGSVVTWPAVVSLASGASVAYTLVARAADGGSYTNIAASASPTPDPDLSNNNGSAPGARPVVNVAASADVVTTKSGPATATAGQNVAYTITTQNNGPSTATSVVVTDTLPAGLTFVSASGGGTVSGNVVTWPTIASLANGASQSFTVTALAATAGSWTNVVASTAATTDPTPNNNNGSAPAARVTTTIAASADVSVAKSGPATGVVGQDLVYTIDVSNAGPSSAASVVVTDTIPAGMAFVSANGGGTATGNVVTWPTIASLASGGSSSFTLTLRATTAATFTNIAASSSPTADANPSNNNGSTPASRAQTVVGPSADVAVTKTGPATATAGQDITYTITTTNNGPSPAVNVVVTDTLPLGITFVSASNGGTAVGNVITWPAIASLANGGNAAYTVVVRAANGGSYLDIAAATSSTPDQSPSNNDGSQPAARVNTVVGASADLVTTKTGPPNATAGADVTYTIITLNNGPSTASDVVLSDTLATGAVFVSASNGGTLSGNVVTWPAVPSLVNGGTVSYTVTVRFNNAGGYLDIAASNSPTADPVPANNDGSAPSAQVITVVGASADLVTTKTGPAAATAGADVVYTIVTTNQGPSGADNVVVTDTLPAGATFVSASNGGTASASVVTWPSVATLASAASVSYTVTVRYTAAGGYTNIAASTSSTPDPFPSNNDGTPPDGRASTVVGPAADLVTNKSGPASALAGEDIVYSIITTNNGPTPAVDVVVTDTLPAGMTFVSTTGGGTLVGNVITWPAIATMANGASTTFSVVVRAITAGTYVNWASSASTTPDPDQSNNDGSAPASRVSTVVGLSADVVATKTGPAVAAVGQNVTYSITVVNNGPSLATDVIVTDTLPAGVTFVSASSGGIVAGNVVTWPTIASLAVGIPTTFTVTVTAGPAGSYTNVVASTSTTPDPTPANNNGSAPASRATTVVSTNSDVAVSKTGPTVVVAGQNATYTITVSNNGPASALGVVVSDTLPSGFTFVSASSGGSASGNVVTWPAVTSLVNGSTVAFTVTARANNVGSFTNLAAVRSTSTDPNLANNIANASTIVSAAPINADVVTTKTGPAAVSSGASIVYTIQTINAGPDAAANVVVTDTLPSGATFVSATGNPVLAGNVLTWPTIATLPNGASVTFNVTIAAPAAVGNIVNIAANTSTSNDPVLSNNNGSANNSRSVTVIAQAADLVTTKTGPANAPLGGTVTYTITTRNDGPDGATNVLVTDSIPSGALFVSASDGGAFSGGVVTWPLVPTLANDASVTFTVTVIAPTSGPSMTNVARSTSATPDPNTSNNRGTATTTLSASADVVTTKSGPAKVDAGAEITYSIVTKNRGPNAASAVIVVDSLPVGVTFVSASGGGTVSGRIVTWPAISSIAVGDSVVLNLVVTAPNASATLVNVVRSTATTPDPDTLNNDGSDAKSRVVTEVAPVDLEILKVHTGDLVRGTIALYTLTVNNVGPTATTGPIVVRDTLPTGLTLRSATGSGWNCVNAGQIVTCRYDAVPFAVGATTTITLKVLVGSDAPTTLVNRAHVSTLSDTESGGNNVGTDQATVSSASPIVVSKTASKTDAEVADVIDYAVIVTNRSTAIVPGVSVSDVLPKGMSYQRNTARVDLIPIPDPAGAPGPTLTFQVGDLEPNATVKLTYRVKVGAGATLGDGINRAKATTTTGLSSSEAISVVRIRGGAFTDRGIVVGKVYLRCDCDSAGQVSRRSGLERDTLGVPGVRLFLEDGTSTVTDLEGKYNFSGLVSGLHVIKVDPTTLPRGAWLMALDSRNAGDSSSRFVDLKNGELHKADFAIRFADSLRGRVDLRRERGEILGAVIDSLAGIETTDTLARPFRTVEAADADRPVIAVDQASDTLKANAYRPLAAQTSANPIDEANRLPIRRLPGTTIPLTAVPNGSVELVPARRSLPADGNTAIAVRVRVLDQERKLISTEQPVTLETSLGRWLVQDLDPVEPGIQVLVSNGTGDFTLVASSEPGVGEIRATNGLRISTAQLVFLPAERPFFANGVLEARVDLRSLLRDGLVQVTNADRFERELRDLRVESDNGKFSAAARGALFLQGKVKGSTLLTLAFDSERDPEKRMFRDIQPEEFYPVYGDASIKEFGAQSFDRLYVRIDAERSFALYGDYVTPSAGTGALAARELGAYQRSLTGGLVHGEDRRGQFNAFASRDRLSQVVDEIPGRGVSGPYQLSRTDGRLNSEKVEILTRDRNQPSRILSVVQLARFTDYTVEPFTGRLLFFTPVPSVDSDLNPVSIRVLYEVERSGEEFWVFGADGQLRVGDKVEFGAGIVRDEQPQAKRQLYSANAALALGSGTVLATEFARTEGDSVLFRGSAMRFDLRHSSEKVQGSVFGAISDAGFSNQSSTFQRGRREFGIRGSAVIDERTRFLGEALRTDDRINGGHRTGLLAGVERQFGKFVRAELGYRYGQEEGGAASAGTAATPNATPNETNAIRTRLTFQVPGQPKASLFGEFEQDVAHSSQRRGALGGQYVLFDRLRLYGRHEFLNSFAGPFALNGAQKQATTVIGLDAGYTKDGQFFGEYRASDAFSGRETEAAIGLRNRWSLAKGLVVNTGFERVDVLKGIGQGEATAISAGAEYTTSPAWRGTARLEYRFAPLGDDFLGTLGYVRKLDRDWTFLGRSLFNTFGGGKRTRNQLGFAWRETDQNRWNGLARWEHRYERLGKGTANASLERSQIVSAHLNYQPVNSVWLSGRFAGKWAKDERAGLSTTSQASMVWVRGLYDLAPRWDAGLIGSAFWSEGTRYGVGLEFGRTVVKNFRAALGYNLFGYKDSGLVGDGSQTDGGLYLHFGFKFDEEAFRRLKGGESVKP